MADLVVVVPTRNRPAAVRELAGAFGETCTAHTSLVLAVDADDEHLDEYHESAGTGIYATIAVTPAPGTMVTALNCVASAYAKLGAGIRPAAIAFMGDDHRPRTPGWDRVYLDALRELGTGMVYGNDLIQGERLPTQIAMSADIVRALGYMCPPSLTHLYVDDYWRTIGQGASVLRYLPGVVVEHLHPVTGRIPWDEGHTRVNARSMYDADAAALAELARSGALAADIDKVRALRQVAP